MVTFNIDRNARQKDYEDLKDGEVLVTTIFPTLQGEGPFAGMPAIFVRLAGCNLGAKDSCPFCDTYFALDTGQVMSPLAVLKAAMDCDTPMEEKLMVLTGGEPLLQKPFKLISEFIDSGWTVQIETNGYFWSEELLEFGPYECHIVVSPKVNARHEYPKFNNDLLARSACLKILIEDVPNSPYYRVPAFAHDYANEFKKPVYLSPINVYRRGPALGEVVSYWSDILDLTLCEKNTRYAARLAMTYGYRLSLQTHLLAVLE